MRIADCEHTLAGALVELVESKAMNDENIKIDFSVKTAGVYAIPKPRQPSDWRANFVNEIFVTPEDGYEPNAFHRLMHRLILGIKWERVKP